MSSVVSASRSLSGWFVSGVRLSGVSFVHLDEGAPGWLVEAVLVAHGDEMPNDWCYDRLRLIAGCIEDGADESGVIADQLVDVYNSDRLVWLAGDLGRSAFVDEFITDYGSTDHGLFAAIGGGQWLQLDQMASVLLAAVDEAYEAYTVECEAENLDAHYLHMWFVHGMPAGPLGSSVDHALWTDPAG